MRIRRHLIALTALCLVGWSAAVAWRAPSWPNAFAAPAPAPGCTGTALFDTSIFHRAAPDYAHAITAIFLKDGRLRAFWYEGEVEVGRDVTIRSADFDGMRWSAPRVIIDIPRTIEATGRYVKSLGNTLVYRDPAGELVLLYASVGIGRWSGASLNIMHSRDDGESWSTPRRLLTTPTFNFSTLVRSPAVAMEGGFTLVPAYQEFLRRFPEVLLLDRGGEVVGRRRIDNQQQAIQPLVIVLGAREALAFSRTGGGAGTVLISETLDAGWSWTSRASSPIPNFDKPVAGVRLDTGEILLIHNAPDSGGENNGPFVFTVSDDRGLSWRRLSRLALDRPGTMMHYPTLLAGSDGVYHLLFTHSLARGSQLIHVRFNRDWIAQSGGPVCR